ncbi:putative membrane protein, partial [Bacteroides fragilis str. 2-F-2 
KSMFSLADDGLASILCNTSIYSYFVGNFIVSVRQT